MNRRVEITKDKLQAAVNSSFSYRATLISLGLVGCGGNYKTLQNRIKEFDIDISHFKFQGWNRGNKKFGPRRNVYSYFVKGKFTQSYKLKQRIVNAGIKEDKCELCGIVDWQGKSIALELDHIDGDHMNNLLGNLRILCPNCHSQTPTHRGKNRKTVRERQEDIGIATDPKRLWKPTKEMHRRYEERRKTNSCKICSKPCKNKYCSYACSHLADRRCVRPDKDELACFIEVYPMVKIGKMFGVSDNAVKKWAKAYGLIPT